MYLAVALFFITNLFSLYRLSELSLALGSSELTSRLVAQCSRRQDQLRLIMGFNLARWSVDTSHGLVQSQTTLGVQRSCQRCRLGAEK